jgi:hypothetical protein
MGLDISHNTWSGAYSSFSTWRQEVARVAKLPNLNLMEGFGGNMPWDSLLEHPLYELMNHPDNEGEIEWRHLAKIADELERLLPLLPDEKGVDVNSWFGYRDRTEQFIKGLRLAYKKKENLRFH